jgi:hypothetical protein
MNVRPGVNVAHGRVCNGPWLAGIQGNGGPSTR